MGQYGGGGSTSEAGGAGGGGYVPLEITTGLDFGYDDHVIGSNAAGNSSSPSSFFAKENLVLTYDRPGEQTEFRLLGVGRFTQFFDVGADDKDVSCHIVVYAQLHDTAFFQCRNLRGLPDGA